MVEEVLEGVMFDVEAGVRYVITDKTVRGGEAVKQSMTPAEGTAELACAAAAGCREDRIIPEIEITSRQ